MSIPSSICLRTMSATAPRNRAACAFSSTRLPCSLACTTSSRSAGPGRRPPVVGGNRSRLPPAPPPPRCLFFRIVRDLHDTSHHHFSCGGRALVKFRIHPARKPLARERRFEFAANGGILLVIGDGAAAFAQLDRAIVHELLAGAAR